MLAWSIHNMMLMFYTITHDVWRIDDFELFCHKKPKRMPRLIIATSNVLLYLWYTSMVYLGKYAILRYAIQYLGVPVSNTGVCQYGMVDDLSLAAAIRSRASGQSLWVLPFGSWGRVYGLVRALRMVRLSNRA